MISLDNLAVNSDMSKFKLIVKDLVEASSTFVDVWKISLKVAVKFIIMLTERRRNCGNKKNREWGNQNHENWRKGEKQTHNFKNFLYKLLLPWARR